MFLARKRCSGITVAEVLIVVTLLAVMAVFVTPSFRYYFTQNRLKSVAEAFYNDVLLARTSAIKQASDVTLTLSAGSSWCFGFATSGVSCTCTNTPSSSNCNLGARTSADFPDTTLSLTGFSGNNTTFSATRAVPTSTGSAIFTNNGNAITVSVNRLGTSRICSNDLAGYGSCS